MFLFILKLLQDSNLTVIGAGFLGFIQIIPNIANVQILSFPLPQNVRLSYLDSSSKDKEF